MPDTGHCRVCLREVAVNSTTGIPIQTHNRTIDHNPDADENNVVIASECYGSRLPCREFAAT